MLSEASMNSANKKKVSTASTRHLTPSPAPVLRVSFGMILLMIILLIIGCSNERIPSAALEDNEVVLEKNNLQLDPFQQEELFLGVYNRDAEKKAYAVQVSCAEANCEQNVGSQFFPSFEVEGKQKIAIPLLWYAPAESQKGSYHFTIAVSRDAVVLERLQLTVDVRNTVEEKKQELLGTGPEES